MNRYWFMFLVFLSAPMAVHPVRAQEIPMPSPPSLVTPEPIEVYSRIPDDIGNYPFLTVNKPQQSPNGLVSRNNPTWLQIGIQRDAAVVMAFSAVKGDVDAVATEWPAITTSFEHQMVDPTHLANGNQQF